MKYLLDQETYEWITILHFLLPRGNNCSSWNSTFPRTFQHPWTPCWRPPCTFKENIVHLHKSAWIKLYIRRQKFYKSHGGWKKYIPSSTWLQMDWCNYLVYFYFISFDNAIQFFTIFFQPVIIRFSYFVFLQNSDWWQNCNDWNLPFYFITFLLKRCYFFNS